MQINQNPDKWFESTVVFTTSNVTLELPLPPNTSSEASGLRSVILVSAAIAEEFAQTTKAIHRLADALEKANERDDQLRATFLRGVVTDTGANG